jgi:hypothetical protein
MDPVSAFALAGTVLQVLDLSKQYLTLVWKVYKSSAPGADGEESSLAQTRNALLAVTESLQGSLPSSASGAVDKDSEAGLARNESLERLAKDCHVVAQRLLTILQKTVPKSPLRKRDAFKAAFRLMCSEDEIKRLESLIATYRDQFSFLLLTSIRCVALDWSCVLLMSFDTNYPIVSMSADPRRSSKRFWISLASFTIRPSKRMDHQPPSLPSLRRSLLRRRLLEQSRALRERENVPRRSSQGSNGLSMRNPNRQPFCDHNLR